MQRVFSLDPYAYNLTKTGSMDLRSTQWEDLSYLRGTLLERQRQISG